jgi:hypothetical protein
VTGRRDEVVNRIIAARSRQFNLPGSEHDAAKRANDWIATVASYLGEAAERFGAPPSREEFEDSFTKAAAIILAALEHAEQMQAKGLIG